MSGSPKVLKVSPVPAPPVPALDTPSTAKRARFTSETAIEEILGSGDKHSITAWRARAPSRSMKGQRRGNSNSSGRDTCFRRFKIPLGIMFSATSIVQMATEAAAVLTVCIILANSLAMDRTNKIMNAQLLRFSTEAADAIMGAPERAIDHVTAAVTAGLVPINHTTGGLSDPASVRATLSFLMRAEIVSGTGLVAVYDGHDLCDAYGGLNVSAYGGSIILGMRTNGSIDGPDGVRSYFVQYASATNISTCKTSTLPLVAVTKPYISTHNLPLKLVEGSTNGAYTTISLITGMYGVVVWRWTCGPGPYVCNDIVSEWDSRAYLISATAGCGELSKTMATSVEMSGVSGARAFLLDSKTGLVIGLSHGLPWYLANGSTYVTIRSASNASDATGDADIDTIFAALRGMKDDDNGDNKNATEATTASSTSTTPWGRTFKTETMAGFVVSSMPVEIKYLGTPWTLFYAVPEDFVYSEIRKMMYTSIWIAAVVLVIAAVASVIWTRAAVSGPIEAMSKMLGYVTSLDVDAVRHVSDFGDRRLVSEYRVLRKKIDDRSTAEAIEKLYGGSRFAAALRKIGRILVAILTLGIVRKAFPSKAADIAAAIAETANGGKGRGKGKRGHKSARKGAGAGSGSGSDVELGMRGNGNGSVAGDSESAESYSSSDEDDELSAGNMLKEADDDPVARQKVDNFVASASGMRSPHTIREVDDAFKALRVMFNQMYGMTRYMPHDLADELLMQGDARFPMTTEHVVVVQADQINSTEFAGNIEKDKAKLYFGYMSRYHNAVQEQFKRCNVPTNNLVGDAVIAMSLRGRLNAEGMACIGAVRAHRAVASLSLQLDEAQSYVGFKRLVYRTGIASGDAPVGDLGNSAFCIHTAMGMVPSIAARVESAASLIDSEAHILVEESTWMRAVEQGFAHDAMKFRCCADEIRAALCGNAAQMQLTSSSSAAAVSPTAMPLPTPLSLAPQSTTMLAAAASQQTATAMVSQPPPSFLASSPDAVVCDDGGASAVRAAAIVDIAEPQCRAVCGYYAGTLVAKGSAEPVRVYALIDVSNPADFPRTSKRGARRAARANAADIRSRLATAQSSSSPPQQQMPQSTRTAGAGGESSSTGHGSYGNQASLITAADALSSAIERACAFTDCVRYAENNMWQDCAVASADLCANGYMPIASQYLHLWSSNACMPRIPTEALEFCGTSVNKFVFDVAVARMWHLMK